MTSKGRSENLGNFPPSRRFPGCFPFSFEVVALADVLDLGPRGAGKEGGPRCSGSQALLVSPEESPRTVWRDFMVNLINFMAGEAKKVTGVVGERLSPWSRGFDSPAPTIDRKRSCAHNPLQLDSHKISGSMSYNFYSPPSLQYGYFPPPYDGG